MSGPAPVRDVGKSRAMTADGDLLYEDGVQVWVEGRDAVAQGIGISLTLIQGDDAFFPDLGLVLEDITGASEDDRINALHSALERSLRVRRVLSIERPTDPDRAKRFQYLVRLIDRTDQEITLGVNLGA